MATLHGERIDDLLGGIAIAAHADIDVGDVELVVLGDRTDVSLVDLVLVTDRTAVAQEDGASHFLFEHEAHFALEPDDHVEVSDVQDIVPVQLLLLVDGLGSGDALRDREELFLLQVALHVTLGPCLVEGDVRGLALDPRERGVAGSGHDLGDPLGATLDEFRRAGDRLGVGEQDVDVADAVLECVLLSRLLEGVQLLGAFEDGLRVRVAQSRRGVGSVQGVAFENVVSHGGSFRGNSGLLDEWGSFGVTLVARGNRSFCGGRRRLAGILESLTDHEVDDVLLVFGHTVEDFLDGLVARGCSFAGGCGIGIVFAILVSQSFTDHVMNGFLLSLVHGVENVLDGETFVGHGFIFFVGHGFLFCVDEFETSVNDRFAIDLCNRTIAVCDVDVVDQCTGVGARENKTDFTDLAVLDLLVLFIETVGVNRERRDVSVLDERLGILALVRLVEITVPVKVSITCFEEHVTENVDRFVVGMLPYERNFLPIHMLEGVRKNRSSICAAKVCLGGIPAKVGFHEGSPHFLVYE